MNAILCTHGHNDHIDAAPALADLTGAPILLHPADAALWGMAHPVRQPDAELHDGQLLTDCRGGPRGAAHTRTLARRVCFYLAGAGRGVHR